MNQDNSDVSRGPNWILRWALRVALLLLVVICAEYGLRLFQARWTTGGARNYAANYSRFYGSTVDVEQYQREMRSVYDTKNMSFDDFRGYRPAAMFQGRYVSTDVEGFRNTPLETNGGNARRTILMLGGSTMWGVGTAGDEHTIASALSGIIDQEMQWSYAVKNYGVGGYALAQEMIVLLERLGKEPIDYVVFYDGVNEVEHGQRELYWTGTVGRTPFLQPSWFGRETAVTSRYRDGYVFRYFPGFLWLSSQLLERVLAFPTTGQIYDPQQLERETLDAEMRRVVSEYARLKGIIDALSVEFDFAPLFFLQPSLATKQNVHVDELELSPWDRSWAEMVYAETRKQLGGHENFFDISGCIDTDEHIYLDDHHTGMEGNRRIASCIFREIQPRLQCDESGGACAGAP